MSEVFRQFTMFQPMQTTTTTTTWSGWRTVSPKCYLCVHCAIRGGIPTCWCTSRTLKRGLQGDECLSYWEKETV